MTYDKQLKLYNNVRRGINSLGGYEDLHPHENSYESSAFYAIK